MKRTVALGLVLVGCGYPEPVMNHTTDAAPQLPDVRSPDSGIGACDRTKPFSTPTLLQGVSSTRREEAASFSPDELTVYATLYLAPGGAGGLDIYGASRGSTSDTFPPPTLLQNVDSSADETGAVVTDDGLTMFLAKGTASRHIAMATRANTASGFGTPVVLAELMSSSDDIYPWINSDGTVIYFASSRNGVVYDLMRATRPSANSTTFSTPVVVSVPTPIAVPVLTQDELTLFYASSQAGGVGGVDVWVATRASPSNPFGSPINVASVSSMSDDAPAWISRDQCRLYVATNRAGGVGNIDIWVSSRPQ